MNNAFKADAHRKNALAFALLGLAFIAMPQFSHVPAESSLARFSGRVYATRSVNPYRTVSYRLLYLDTLGSGRAVAIYDSGPTADIYRSNVALGTHVSGLAEPRSGDDSMRPWQLEVGGCPEIQYRDFVRAHDERARWFYAAGLLALFVSMGLFARSHVLAKRRELQMPASWPPN